MCIKFSLFCLSFLCTDKISGTSGAHKITAAKYVCTAIKKFSHKTFFAFHRESIKLTIAPTSGELIEFKHIDIISVCVYSSKRTHFEVVLRKRNLKENQSHKERIWTK